MKNKFVAFSIALLLWISIFHPSVIRADNTPVFSLTITNGSPTVDSQFQVTVNGAQLTDLYAYEVNLTYDASKLLYVSAVSGMSGFTVSPNVNGNTIRLAHTQTGAVPGLNGNAALATLTFKAIDSGSAEIALASLKLVNSQLTSTPLTSNARVLARVSQGITPEGPPAGTPVGPPAGTPVGPPAGTPVGPPAGTPAGPPAGTPAGPQSGPTITLASEAAVDPKKNSVTSTIDSVALVKAMTDARSDASGKTNISIEVKEVADAKVYVQQLPSEAISNKEKPVQIEIKTSLASVIVPSNMFQGNNLPVGEVGLHIGQADTSTLDNRTKKMIGAHPVLELSVQSGDKTIRWSNPKAPVAVSVPYKPTVEELKDPEHIVIWYVDGNGNINSVPSGKYDPITGQVTFMTTHFSKYAVAFVNKTFDDIASVDWAKKQIEVLASKGIINGTSESQFNPAEQVTRADFLILLVRTLDLKGEMGSRFADVPEGAYYDEALRIARGLGITNGIGDNLFKPQASITREDMMVLTERALKAAKKLTPGASEANLNDFNDIADIADYAVNSVASLVKSGLVNGYDHGVFPKKTTTRAESAKLMYSIYNY